MAESIAKDANNAFSLLKTLSNDQGHLRYRKFMMHYRKTRVKLLKPIRLIWIMLLRATCLHL